MRGQHNNDGENSSRPRKLIHDAQEYAYKWHEVCLRVHQGVADVDPDLATRMFHSAVLNYWTQMRRFSEEPRVKGQWEDEALWEDGEEDVTLSDIGDRYRFASTTEQLSEYDVAGGEDVQTESMPVCLSVGQSTRLLDKLDNIAHTLAFDAQPGEKEGAPQVV
ncbi:hypothetical protein [Halomarina rubra]|uniref:Uncharacterized protein n=1 Tax=Halomarina rubra TaxID=2071873 RepID=A0ABD6B126_9EURY|nr:hypothetical protein [Halomarina rubra]